MTTPDQHLGVSAESWAAPEREAAEPGLESEPMTGAEADEAPYMGEPTLPDAATWRYMQGLAAMAERSPNFSPEQVLAEREAASQTFDAGLRAVRRAEPDHPAFQGAAVGSPEHYANYEKYFALQNGVGFAFPDNPRASYESDYAYVLERDPDPEAETEIEWADEWDSAESNAYQDRVEPGLEPEAGG